MSSPEGMKKIGVPAAVAAACGLVVASSTLVSLGQGFGLGGTGFIWAMIIAALINLFVAFSFAELSGIIPKAGSISHYTLPALGRFWAIVAVVAGYIIVTIFAASAESAVLGMVFSEVFLPGVSPLVFSVVVVLVLAYVNHRGIDVFAWVQMILTAVMMGTLVIMGLMGLFGASPNQPVAQEGGLNPMGAGVLALTALGFWLFVGLEFVTPMAEEIKSPNKTIPLAMISALVVILVAKVLFGFAGIRYVPMATLAGSEMPHVEIATGIVGGAGAIWMAIVTLMASASTLNTLLAAIPRLLYGMAAKGQVPAFFGKLHPTNRTPTYGILFITLCILVPLLIGITNLETILVYILAAVFAWLLSYTIAHINVMVLRVKYPNIPRPFKTPLYPLPQILGIAAMVYIGYDIFPDPAMKVQIWTYAGLFLLIAAVLAVIWLAGVKKLPLFKAVPLNEVLEESKEESAVGG